ncbi:MAG: ORF6N domain-containing protein [Candidatus Taylorbacteria bacterium]|nr:ORF6N domain-containing protein [Candidatus Taylorbacteria bacterium]
MMDKNLQTKSLITSHTVIERRIFLIRGQKVMIDSDLAELYGEQVKVLIQSIKRNRNRFPDDFMFQLTDIEYESLRSQIVTSKVGRGGRRYLPYVFTEHGVAMLSSVLKSKKAVQMNILIIRAFIKIREILASNKELAGKIDDLEREQTLQNKHINKIYSIIGKLLEEPQKSKESIGFRR